MKHVVIIGNSAAGIAAAETLRAGSPETSISIVSDENGPAYERFRILDILEGKAMEKELVFRGEDFYRKNAIGLLPGKEVVGLHLTRKRVVFKDKETLDFDELIIASGAAVKLPSLKGIQKEGVVALGGLKDIRFLRENLPLAHTVLMVGSDETARRLSAIIAAKKIEVKFFGAYPEPPAGVEVIAENPITEILGEGEARAARLASGKVLGASIIIFTGPREPRMDFLRDTEIQTRRGILVDDAGRTNIPFVYAAGDVAEPVDGHQKSCGWERAQAEGRGVRVAV